MPTKTYGYRGMLNARGFGSTAAIVAELSNAEGYWNATLKLSDCDRAIRFDLCDPITASDAEFDNVMDKLYKISYACRELSKGMRSVRRRGR